jgi:hypothetical protein
VDTRTTTVFETAPFNHSGTSPNLQHEIDESEHVPFAGRIIPTKT